jgi:hypothetical protein
MRILAASIVMGPLMLIGVLQAAAGQAALELGSGGVPIQLAGNDSTADRDTYTQKARNDMQEWQHKLDGFSENAKVNGQKAGEAAGNDLYQAWAQAKDKSSRLQTAGAQDWQSARISYVKATRDLANAWDRIRPEDR